MASVLRWLLPAALIWAAGCSQGIQTAGVAPHATGAPSSVGIGRDAARVPGDQKADSSRQYKIGAQDVLEISVFRAPELSKVVQVADAGVINLPLVGDIDAAGRTARDIEGDIVRRLGEAYMRNPQVSVYLKEYNSHRITVEGAVKKPGVFAYRGTTSLLQAIAMAEGLDPLSDSHVLVFRTLKGKRAAAKFDIARIRSGMDPDPDIQPGDIVVVPTSTVKETFNTLLRALPLAGIFAFL